MADLSSALPWVLSHEGGWSDDADDPGGATNLGITLAVAKRHGIETKEELKALTLEQAEAIYRSDYWRFDGIHCQSIATKIFDLCVNMGRKSVISLVQQELNDLGASLINDGCYGPQTEDVINAVDPRVLMSTLCLMAEERYRHIVFMRPTSAKFLNGWLRRAHDVPVAA